MMAWTGEGPFGVSALVTSKHVTPPCVDLPKEPWKGSTSHPQIISLPGQQNRTK